MNRKIQSLFLVLLAAVLVVLGTLTRLFPHPANFTAIGAVGLFAGAFMPKKWAIVVPVLAMAISDIFLGFHSLMIFTWGSMMLSVGIGIMMRKQMHVGTVVAGTLIGSLQFYLITNWAVWMFTPMYSKGIDGLFASYVAGIPFFRNSIAGDLFFVTVLFGVYASIRMLINRFAAVPSAYLNKK